MSWPKDIFLYGVFLSLVLAARTDVMVQLNINRPINDVSDKFVSFTMRPEDLYKALDSSNRKTITRMASMLSNSHIKFVGDYYFASKTEGIRLRNPTKIVWKGFNKWTKAVNWSMIIPVPYKPDNWDPMETLKILNTSQMVDIDEAIWQLGTDFGSARAADYVSELKTFNVMVDSFKQTVTNWQTMGADISAGSSPDETRRYVEMSRDLNVAYGWIQNEDIFSNNNLGSSLEGQDPALKVLFKSKVPVWLSFPKRKTLSLHMDDEVTDGLSWAQTMGEAANVGFESIFKHLTLEDMENPKYAFYVTVFFKKIMGSRVYPARPLSVLNRNNKLYTHCANMVSGGLAFMVVNKEEEPLQIAVRPMNKLLNTEVWQYALTMQSGQVMLNNNKLFLNSTLVPEVRRRNTKGMLQLKTPGLSVSFWVLPNTNLEHCHFNEIEAPVVPTNNNQKIKRYSASDRLLKELIKESTKPSFSPLANLMRRNRRSVDKDDRYKRFLLEGGKDEVKPIANLAENLFQDMKSPLKRDIFSPDRRNAAMQWLSSIFKEPLNLPLLKRNARQSDSQRGPFFMTRDGKKTAFTKKITEIKKPERKRQKFLFEDQEFDEEKFFKNVMEQPEPEYVRVPEGDVFLSNIASVDGEELEDELNMETKEPNKARARKKEIVSEMKPLRLLPTEFFESLPPKPVQPLPSNMDSTLNSLLYSDAFHKTYGEADKKNCDTSIKEDTMAKEILDPETHKDSEAEAEAETNHEEDDVTQTFAKKRAVEEEDEESTGKKVKSLLDAVEEKPSETMNNFNLFGDSIKNEADKGVENEDDKSAQTDEIPWWDLSPKRLKRSLDSHSSTGSWSNNMIIKNDEPITAANELSPARLHQFEHKVEEVLRSTNNNSKNKDYDDDSFGKKIVNTFKMQVTKFLDVFSQQANEWYNSFTKQLDSAFEETTTERNRIT